MGIWEFMVVREVWLCSIRGEKFFVHVLGGGEGGDGEKEKTL
jgi:hypothetical protein